MVGYDDAFALSRSLLAEALPDRWRHVQSVADQAGRIGAITGIDAEDLRTAAILHDIGYSPSIAHLRFHPLDGARLLKAEGYPQRIVSLVARHSGAVVEGKLRGLGGVEEFEDEASPTRDALWYCDATTGPQGQRLSPDERWEEIRTRYGSDSLVARFLDLAEPELRGAVDRTLGRMREAGITP
jgi:putative nucleotidyltransferase with HDIG domain